VCTDARLEEIALAFGKTFPSGEIPARLEIRKKKKKPRQVLRVRLLAITATIESHQYRFIVGILFLVMGWLEEVKRMFIDE